MCAQADILLVTVNKYETGALTDVFQESTGIKAETVTIEDRVYRDLGEVNGTRVFHALSEMGSGGLGAAQQAVDKGIRALNPDAVVALGVAFGINEKKQKIGDILLSKQIRPYELQRAGEEIILRGDKPHASARLINFFEGIAQTSWDGAEVRPGVILTGEKLVDRYDFRTQLAKFEPEAIGGEMEGNGVYVSSQDQKVDWIVIKAICDWADGRKRYNKSKRQREAAVNAASFVLHALHKAQFKPIERRPVESQQQPKKTVVEVDSGIRSIKPRPSTMRSRSSKLTKTCFVICPLGNPGSDERKRSDYLLDSVIIPETKKLGYKTDRADLADDVTRLNEGISRHLFEDDLVIADLTDRNPNVLYELGKRHAWGKKCIHLCVSAASLPFNVQDFKAIQYVLDTRESVAKAKKDLRKAIRAQEHARESMPLALRPEDVIRMAGITAVIDMKYGSRDHYHLARQLLEQEATSLL